MISNKKLIEKELNAFFVEKFPESIEEFELVLKSATGSDINSTHTQNLVNSIYYAFLQQRADGCTQLYILIRQFAKSFKDTERIKLLSKIWNGALKDSLPVPILEAIIIRDLSNPGFRVGQTYNYGRGKIYRLSDLLTFLQSAKTLMMDVFNDIYLENDLQFVVNIPAFEKDNTGGLPSL